MLEWFLSSSVLILLVLLLRFLLKGRIYFRLQYALWLPVLLRLLIPISMGSSPISILNVFSPQESPSQTAPYVPLDPLIEIQTVTPIPTAPTMGSPSSEEVAEDTDTTSNTMPLPTTSYSVSFTWADVKVLARLLYLVGAGAVLLFFLLRNATFSRRLRRSRYPLDMEAGIFVTGAIETPCLFGILLPCIYVTSEIAENETALRHCITHEQTHRAHRDHIWAILRCACLALHWYNPLVWIAAMTSATDAELACDECTLRSLGTEEQSSYGRTLLTLSCSKRSAALLTATTMSGSKKELKKRITAIVRKPKMAVYTPILLLMICAVVVTCTFTGVWAREESNEAFLRSVSQWSEAFHRVVRHSDGQWNQQDEEQIRNLEVCSAELHAQISAYEALSAYPDTRDFLLLMTQYAQVMKEKTGTEFLDHPKQWIQSAWEAHSILSSAENMEFSWDFLKKVEPQAHNWLDLYYYGSACPLEFPRSLSGHPFVVRELPVQPVREPDLTAPTTKKVSNLLRDVEQVTLTLHSVQTVRAEAKECIYRSFSLPDAYAHRLTQAVSMGDWCPMAAAPTASKELWITAETADHSIVVSFWLGKTGILELREGIYTYYWQLTDSQSVEEYDRTVRLQYDLLECGTLFPCRFTFEGNGEEATAYFIHQLLPRQLLNLSPGNQFTFTDYEGHYLDGITGEDTAHITMLYTCRPSFTVDIPYMNAYFRSVSSQHMEVITEFTLQRVEGDVWHCENPISWEKPTTIQDRVADFFSAPDCKLGLYGDDGSLISDAPLTEAAAQQIARIVGAHYWTGSSTVALEDTQGPCLIVTKDSGESLSFYLNGSGILSYWDGKNCSFDRVMVLSGTNSPSTLTQELQRVYEQLQEQSLP